MFDPKNWPFKHSNKVYRDNYLKAVRFESPDWIPCSMSIFGAVWAKHREKLKEIVVRHPFIFGKFMKAKWHYDSIPKHHQANSEYYDNWGCKWQVLKGGYEGQVIEHPLADWNALQTYQFPDPLKKSERGGRTWRFVKAGFWFAHKSNILVSGSGERLFDRVYFLRGFDNLMKDFATNNPNLPILLQRLQEHELRLVNKWLEMSVDQMSFHTDIGTQDRLMISPRQFRKYIKPWFTAIFEPCRKANIPVYLSSDGYLLDIVDDLKECGVSIHDPQYRANTLEGIAKYYKGKMCIDLDLDRQSFPFLTPEGIRKQIKDAVDMLATPEGGFMMKAEIGDPNIPLENIEAICQAFDDFAVLKK